ncbi:MAG: polysaccharide deacetylase family protein [Clostridia bacterium]|nr:polysaccharide deacetylase family protein [Clostridia bacterium]
MKYNFLRFPNFKRKAVTLSYDDGVVFDRKLIEIMDKYGLKGTFNINSGLFGKEPGGRRMTREEAYELYANSPHEVAVHGFCHLSLAEVDRGIATYDVIEDRKELEEMFGRVIKGMAYANGSVDDKVVETLKACGISYSRTVVSTEAFAIPEDWLRLPATCHHKNPRLMELAQKFVETENDKRYTRNNPMLFYLWGHSYEFNDDDNWGIIEEFAQYIGGREDIWYATNGEIYEYVQAFNRLQFSVNGNLVHNPSAIDVYLCHRGKNVLVPAGQTVHTR